MNPAIFFDTETSKFPLWEQPSESPEQPHIVQLAALMVDLDTQKTLQTIDVIIKPVNWVITQETIDVHGITQEHAMDVGIDEHTAVDMLLDLVGDRVRIAHNHNFDNRIIRIALMRYYQNINDNSNDVADKWKAGASECTAQLSRSICALPKTKIPTLTEAYMHFFGKPFDNAHSALADAMACRDVYFAVKGLNVEAKAA